MYSKRGFFINCTQGGSKNRTAGEFINYGFVTCKGLLCGNPTEREESLELNFCRQSVYKSILGTLIVCRKQGASGQKKTQYIKYFHYQELTGQQKQGPDQNRGKSKADETRYTCTFHIFGSCF